jgi:hypothetical protein
MNKNGRQLSVRAERKGRFPLLRVGGQCHPVYLFIALIACATGCISGPPPNQALDKSLIETEPVKVRSIIAQDEVFIPVKETHSGVPLQSGLIEGVIHAIFEAPHQVRNDAKYARARRLLGPLLEQTLTVEFRANYWDGLKRTLQSPTGMKIGDIQTDTQTRQVTIADLREQPFLALNTSYHLSDDCSVLIIQTQFRYFQSGNNRPVSYGFLTYFSDEIGPEREDSAIAKWAANGAATYRATLNHGISETMKMLRFAILEPTTADAVGTTTPAKEAPKGIVLAKDGERSIIKVGGDLASFSSKSRVKL